MNESDQYILNAIKVWSGFYSPAETDSMIDDILEPDANEAMLRAAVSAEYERKAAAEVIWPRETDCDRLDAAFAELNAQGIIAIQNAGYEMSDGITDVVEAIHYEGRDEARGYCFYHGQDWRYALTGHGLMLAFGNLDNNCQQKLEVGHFVKQVVEKHGFQVEWNGDPESRLKIPHIDWKRRGPRQG